MKLSACLIVKNEARILEQTLPSLSKYAAEIILVDTGSSDNTIEVARKFGARVYQFAWINDFSAARNESLKHATGDWIIWIDADEYLKEEDLKLLTETLAGSKAMAHSLSLYESKLGACERKNGYQRVKVFRNGQGYHFTRPINEQLVDKNGQVVKGEAVPAAIYHWGKNLGEQKMKEKREGYVRLYSKALETKPNDPYLHFLLANNLKELGQEKEALGHYEKAYELAPDQLIGRQGLEKKADILLRLKKLPEAAQAAQSLLVIDADNIPARNVFASIFLVSGKIDNAIQLLQEALSIKTKGAVENLYQSKAMPNFLLGKAYELKGEKDKAQACYAEYNKLMR